jgi:hypothetical protein
LASQDDFFLSENQNMCYAPLVHFENTKGHFPMPQPSPRLTLRERTLRRNRVFAGLLEGQSAAAVAADEGITPRRVRQMVKETLDRWDADPAQDFADLQIARLELALRPLEQKIAAGDVSLVSKFVKVLSLLDKYHDSPMRVIEKIAEKDRESHFTGWLERLAASRDAVAARLAGDRRTSAPVDAAEPATKTDAVDAEAPVASGAAEETTALPSPPSAATAEPDIYAPEPVWNEGDPRPIRRVWLG